MARVEFLKLDEKAIIPTYGTEKCSGMDLYALEDFNIEPWKVTKVKTGVAVNLPEGYEGQIRPRSGLASKHGITVVNTPGTIDEDYTGELIVLLCKVTGPDLPYKGKAGDRIAQLVVKAVEYHEIVEIQKEELKQTDRGSQGFGSTGR